MFIRRRGMRCRSCARAPGTVPPSPWQPDGTVIGDPHAALRDQVLQRVIHGSGESDVAIRRSAAEGKGVPADLQALVDKIHRHAYKVTDDDMMRAQAKYGDDQMFEIVVSSALGASRQRLIAGLEALDEA